MTRTPSAGAAGRARLAAAVGALALLLGGVVLAAPDAHAVGDTGCYYSHEAQRHYCYGNQGGGFAPSEPQNDVGAGYYYHDPQGHTYTPNRGSLHNPGAYGGSSRDYSSRGGFGGFGESSSPLDRGGFGESSSPLGSADRGGFGGSSSPLDRGGFGGSSSPWGSSGGFDRDPYDPYDW
ncbi:hypothetical protein ER308_04515 [Egibacter rhizosphaerae]|uniref:YHYH domain-containing protein n=1 Tax=Egibacter rhizosphaerae TaxID=1670831 RepID=A0A411YCE9_9ACTN|nr:hypothetical protein [Egibacter rhizosphaerae]QBI18879.1 hypothetical protein ER308_04515 [Egibacter rhizosphaerae]